MNKKGMSLVELIITFALVMIMVVGLYNLILEAKFQLDEKQNAKDLAVFSSTINNKIHYHLLKNRNNISKIYIKGSNSSCIAKSGDNCENISSKCYSSMDECLVYKYKNSNDVDVLMVVGVGSKDGRKGIYFGPFDNIIFEAIPVDNDLIESNSNGFLSFDMNNVFLSFDYPIYLRNEDSDSSHNYGFKIAIKLDQFSEPR